ncbi:hypothetical protein, partial [Streptomyces lunaelactis]|uniref:hypothetical protein n=1 Tax=Streptomyces lunaelactis TaxID=1535768 RepID=UPI001C300F2D
YTATALDGSVQGGSGWAAAGQSWATTATGDAACSMTAWATWPMCGLQRTEPDATGRPPPDRRPRRPPTAAA